LNWWPPDTLVPFLAGSRNQDDSSLARQVFADDMIFRVSNHDVVLGINAQVLGTIELGIASDAGAPGEACPAGAGHGANFPLDVHDAQRVSGPFKDVDIPLAIHGDSSRIDQRRRASFAPVLRNAPLAVARDGSDDASLHVDGPDAAVLQIYEIEALLLG